MARPEMPPADPIRKPFPLGSLVGALILLIWLFFDTGVAILLIFGVALLAVFGWMAVQVVDILRGR